MASLIAVWLVGPSRSGTAARRGLAPFLARWEIAYGTAALLLFLLVLWGPTVQTTRARLVISVAILLAIGVELLRRQTAREVPDAASVDLGDATRAIFVRKRGGGAPADARLEELERLGRLREQGVLSDEEVAAEKQRCSVRRIASSKRWLESVRGQSLRLAAGGATEDPRRLGLLLRHLRLRDSATSTIPRASLPAECPQCAGEMRSRCPSCDARFSSVFAVECEACGAQLRPAEAFGGPIRKPGR